MENTYDLETKKGLDKQFDFFDKIPMALCLIDIEGEVVVKINSFFADSTKYSENKIYNLKDVVSFIDFDIKDSLKENFKKKVFMMFLKTNDGGILPMVTSSFKYIIDGKIFLLCSNVSVLKDEFLKNFEKGKSIAQNDIFSVATLKSIFDESSLFISVISVNKKKELYLNPMFKRYFSSEIQRTQNSEIFSDLEELDALDKNPFSSTEFEIILGSKWIKIVASYINWDGTKSILMIGKDITKIKKLEDKLLSKATTDNLTKIYNRQAGIDYLNDFLHEKDKIEFTVVYIDIKNIKFVTNNFGLDEGDKYILNIVNVIKSAIRSTDIFVRMLGGEFIIIFPNCISDVVENIMGTIVNKIEFINAQVTDYEHEINYGVLQIDPDDFFEVDEVLKLVTGLMREMD